MFRDYRVVAITPAGRKRYLELLVDYVLRQRHVLDEYQLWVNTDDPGDLAYVDALEDAHPDFITVVHPDAALEAAHTRCMRHFGLTNWPPAKTALIGSFYHRCMDRDTIYVRFDDDVCYVAPEAVEALLAFRVEHPSFFLISANVINHPLCSYLHQQFGLVDAASGLITSDPFCKAGWQSGEVAERIHESFFGRLERGTVDELKFGSWIVHDYTRVMINCLAWFGRDLADYTGRIHPFDEEPWLSVTLPSELNRPVCICGDAIVAHFAYYPQRPYLERRTSVLGRYRALAGLPEATPHARARGTPELRTPMGPGRIAPIDMGQGGTDVR